MLRTFLITLLLYATTLTAFAQTTDTVSASPQHTHKTISDWPEAPEPIPYQVEVITIARPGVRQRCIVRERTANALTCNATHHRPQITYQRDDIAAIIDPTSHTERNIMLIPIALLAVSLVGSFFVPLGWSITLRIFAGLSLCAFGAMGIGMDEGDHNNDILLYQRPNTPLILHLHA